MTDKITLTNLVNLENETTAVNAINANNAAITAAFDNTLSRDGTQPNQMDANLDMNSNRVLNLPAALTANEPLRLQDLSTFNGGGTIASIPTGGVTGTVLTKNSNADFDTAWDAPTAITAAGYSIKGNPTATTAIVSDIQISNLTIKASPGSTDLVMISDQSASGQLKSATIASVGSSSGVSSIDTQTGPFTTGNGIDSTSRVIELTPARRTLPTITRVTSTGSSTYTPPTNILWCKVTCIGAGGGGAGGANGSATGNNGNSTTFSGSGASLTANGGASSAVGNPPGLGGTASGGNILNATGGAGSCGTPSNNSTGQPGLGGSGGSSFFGGGGAGGTGAVAAIAGAANTGGGGGGGGCSTLTNYGGPGGGAGGTVIHLITSPSGSYTYSVGTGGTGASGGSGGNPGVSGGTGVLIIEEYYGS